MSCRGYARLDEGAAESDGELADDEPAGPADRAAHPTHAALQPFFDDLRARLAAAERQQLRPGGSGVTVRLSVGDLSWLIDLRESVAPARAVVCLDSAQSAELQTDVTVTIADPGDMQLLLLRRLSPFRALALKKVALSGDLRLLHTMEWLLRAGQAASGVVLRVVETGVVDGHGVYRLRVEEGAACWSVTRRWRELRQLSASLIQEFGKGSALNIPLPKLHGSIRSSTSSRTLQQRSLLIEAYLRAVINRLSCSPRAVQGPPVLLRFLGVAPDGSLASSTPETSEPMCTTQPAATAVPAVAAGEGERSPTGRKVSLSGIMLRRELENAERRAVSLEARATAQAWTIWITCIAMLVFWALFIALVVFGPETLELGPVRSAFVQWVPTALMLPGSAAIGGFLWWRYATSESAALHRRYVRVFMLFWSLVALYRVTRARFAQVRAFCADRNEADLREAEIWERTHERAGALLHQQMTSLGGLWVKFGQFLASRADIVPAALGRQLASMLDSNPPRSLSEVLGTLIGAVGIDTLQAMVASIDPTPISVASIAQVHRASLVDGSEVVIKVQHGDVGALIRQDLRQLGQLGRWLACVEPQLDLRPLLQEMVELHEAELDFKLEAANVMEVADNLRRRRVSALLPSVVREMSSCRVLTMSFCEGRSLKEVAASMGASGATHEAGGALTLDCEVLLARVTECWAVQMFADGVFNCDPHPGNLLVQQSERMGPLPVLLDFGLTKRLSEQHLLAFCSMVHALAEFDPDLLLFAVRELGFVFHEAVELEPFDMMTAFLFYFRDTEKDSANSRARIRQRIKEARSRRKVATKEFVKAHGKQAQLKVLPGVIAYFIRTVQMLQGLCTMLHVSLPFLGPMASVAERTLLEHATHRLLEKSALPLLPPSPRPSPTSALHERVLRLMHALWCTGELLGAQACLIHGGQTVVDASYGTMGVVDPRPVHSDSLFQLFEAGSSVLATLVLQEVSHGKLGLLEPIAASWAEFGAHGKQDISLAILLNHASGVSYPASSNLKMSQLSDTAAMSASVAQSSLQIGSGKIAQTSSAAHGSNPFTSSSNGGFTTSCRSPVARRSIKVPQSASSSNTSGTSARVADYEGAAWGWALAGLLREITGQDLPMLVRERICRKLQVKETDLSMHVTPGEESRVVKHTSRAFGGQAVISQMMSVAFAEEIESEDGRVAKPGSSELLGQLSLMHQLSNPAVFNMQQLRSACLPGISMHATAHALASFYASLGAGAFVPVGMLSQATRFSAMGTMKGLPVRWGLGFQLGECHGSQGPRRLKAFGHAASGGTLGLCVPQEGIGLSVTVSKLTRSRICTSKLSELMLAEFGLQLTGFLDERT